MTIDIVSDLHGFQPPLDGGDLLIIAGDLTARDEDLQYVAFEEWFERLPYRRKIIIGGNHDNFLVKYGHQLFLATEDGQPQYLCDSGTEFMGYKIYGSPWTKTFPGMNPHCKAFTVDTEEELAVKFSLIPDDTDILITHSPPNGYLDSVKRINGDYEYTGSVSLKNKVLNLPKLKLHVFGHIHEHGGKRIDLDRVICVNASHVNKRYEPVNKPIRVIL